MTQKTGARAPQIIVIGGGLSGALVSAALLHQPGNAGAILVGDHGVSGHGTAYASGLDGHQANGPAATLSADPDDPDHFTRWLDRIRVQTGLFRDGPTSADLFPPRWLYGRYAADILDQAARAAPGRLRRIEGEVIDLIPVPAGVAARLADGQTLFGSHAVLATGLHFSRPATEAGLHNPWDVEGLRSLAADARVAIVGAGLSMVDAVVTLDSVGHRGPIEVFSRHGRRPHPRRIVPEWPDYLEDIPDRTTIRTIFARVHAECRKAVVAGEDWQGPLDQVRPHIGRWWHGANDAERRRFLRHVRTIWETHHHRAPPFGNALVEAALAQGRLIHHAAQVDGIAPEGPRLRFTPRGSSTAGETPFDAIILSRGVDYDWRRIDRPLAAALLHRGLARPGPLGLGIDADTAGFLRNASGEVELRIAALGPPLRGLWWESTAIPDIARQAHDLAVQLAQPVTASAD